MVGWLVVVGIDVGMKVEIVGVMKMLDVESMAEWKVQVGMKKKIWSDGCQVMMEDGVDEVM